MTNQYTSLRINVDKENYKEAFEVIDILTSMGLQKWIMPYLGLVRDYDGCYKSSKCLNVDDFHDLTKKFNIYVSEKGFVTSEDKDQIPQRINCYCGAEKANSLIISADGELFKCWHDVGNNKQSIGNINSGMQKNLTYMSYVMSDPSEMLDCKHCEYLPICFSGCPNDRNMDTNFKCSTYKPNVEDILQYFVEKSQNKKL